MKRKNMIILSLAIMFLGFIVAMVMLFVENYEWICFIGAIVEFAGIFLLAKSVPKFENHPHQNEKMLKLLKSSLGKEDYSSMQKIFDEYKLDGLKAYQGSILKILYNPSYTSRLVFCRWHYNGVKVFRDNFELFDEDYRVLMCDYGRWISDSYYSYYGGMDTALNDLKTELPAYPNEYPVSDLKINLNTTYLTKIKWSDFKKTNIDIPFGSKKIFDVKIDGNDKILKMCVYVIYWTGYCQSNAYIYCVDDDIAKIPNNTNFEILVNNAVIAKGKVLSLSSAYFDYQRNYDVEPIENNDLSEQ